MVISFISENFPLLDPYQGQQKEMGAGYNLFLGDISF